MMKWIKKLFLVIVIILAVLTLTSFLLPSQTVVAQSQMIKAPAEKIYPYLASLKKFQKWSPWAEMDPDMKLTFSGSDSGKGAKVDWDSKAAGTGSQEITEVVPNQSVKTHLDFGKNGQTTSSLLLRQDGNQTKVTWGLVSENGWNPIARWMGVLFFAPMIAKEYDKGLKKLKNIVESEV